MENILKIEGYELLSQKVYRVLKALRGYPGRPGEPGPLIFI